MKTTTIYKDDVRSWVMFGRDPNKANNVIDTNQYLITHRDRGMLVDPGGSEIFPSYLTALSNTISMEDLESIFASHQDPDIVSSLALWLGIKPELEFFAPSIWEGFIAHFGAGRAAIPIPDEGMIIPLNGSSDLFAVPSHYVHSSGQYGLYDERAKIFFSGDSGAALLPPSHGDIFVSNFDEHIQYMEGFHKRWMPSNRAKNNWVKRVRELDIDIMAPQHGALFRGDDVQRFLDWFEALEVGIAA
ncbi:MAG: MBL fold metallo-hydrolase [Planctomycetes bacterium]|nr:MBL fold metallo-hydrolase [Planctomycetota bacterium]